MNASTNRKGLQMKKMVSMVGVGVMVLSLGLGSAFAQQATNPTVNTPPAASEKDKAPVAKPPLEMKGEKADPMKTTIPGTEAKSGIEVKSQASVPAKTATEMKSEAIAPVKPSVDKATTVKQEDSKAEKTADVKLNGEKKDAKVESSKAPIADTGKKLDEAKSVKQ